MNDKPQRPIHSYPALSKQLAQALSTFSRYLIPNHVAAWDLEVPGGCRCLVQMHGSLDLAYLTSTWRSQDTGYLLVSLCVCSHTKINQSKEVENYL